MIRFSKTYPSIVFATLSVPLTGDRNPSRKGKAVTALRCSEPLRSKVGGPSKVFAILCGMGPPELFLIAVSLCTCRRSNEEYCFYSTFDRITSGEVPIRVMAEIL